MKYVMVVIFVILAFFIGFSMQFVFPELHHAKEQWIEHAHRDHHDEENHIDHHHEHIHEPIEVDPELPIPSVMLEVTKDMMWWYNVHVMTDHFTFTPELATVNGPIANEWHAHLYVNDVKVARVYSEWLHISDDSFVVGENTVRITLNSNNHSDWTKDGEVIGDEVVVVVE